MEHAKTDEGYAFFKDGKSIGVLKDGDILTESPRMKGPISAYCSRLNIDYNKKSTGSKKMESDKSAETAALAQGLQANKGPAADMGAVVEGIKDLAQSIADGQKVAMQDKDQQRIEEAKQYYLKEGTDLAKWAINQYDEPIVFRTREGGLYKTPVLNLRNFDARNGPLVHGIPNPSFINTGTNDSEEGVDLYYKAKGVPEWVKEHLGEEEFQRWYQGTSPAGIFPKGTRDITGELVQGKPFVRGYQAIEDELDPEGNDYEEPTIA